MNDERDERGRFVAGNGGGPGRPRRSVERDYLLSITEAVSLDDWRAIVSKAKQDALAGDDKARAWLTHFLVGDERMSLLHLAALEHLGVDADHEVAGLADLLAHPDVFHIGPEQTPVDRALALISDDVQYQAKAERAKRKATRAAERAAEWQKSLQP